jgi:hypothetical protein
MLIKPQSYHVGQVGYLRPIGNRPAQVFTSLPMLFQVDLDGDL